MAVAVLLAVALAVGFGPRLLRHLPFPRYLPPALLGPKCQVPLQVSQYDENGNGIPDALDLVAGARQEVARHTLYDASYYKGGYPPEGRGACTDLVWRAFRQAGYSLKGMVDQNIREKPDAYGATGRRPDPNIDFRRATTLDIFFKSHALSLITRVIPGNVSNLVQWQPGDIVVFGNGGHIGIISDRRRPDGVPLLIHNTGPWATEGDYLLRYPSPITGHYRFIGPDECYVPAGVIVWDGLPPDGKPMRKTVSPSVFRIFGKDHGWLGGTLEAESASSPPDSVGAGEGWIRESDAVYPQSRETIPWQVNVSAD